MGPLARLTVVLAAVLTLACSGSDKADKAPVKTAKTAQTAPASQPTSQPIKQAQAPKAEVFFVWPDDGSRVPAEFDVVFGLTGMDVSPAGTKLNDPTVGHHHLIIDGGNIAYGGTVPMDEKHLHFGKGQVQTRLKLSPGKHTLTMQFADGAHRSFGPDLSKTITVDVAAAGTGPAVNFIEPVDGAKVPTTFKVKMGIMGMAVRPAGEDAKDKTSGHHHILVNKNPLPVGSTVPNDAQHIHFGKGQTETELTLKPGQHTLTLQLADGAHRSFGPSVSHTINVTVE